MHWKTLLFVPLWLIALPAGAQRTVPAADAANPAATSPAFKYESAFAGYVPFREEQLAPWAELNDDVARAGGHIGILGGGAHGTHSPPQPAASPGASPAKTPVTAPAQPTAAAPHAGH